MPIPMVWLTFNGRSNASQRSSRGTCSNYLCVENAFPVSTSSERIQNDGLQVRKPRRRRRSNFFVLPSSRMHITVLGSRDQLCIHPDVKSLETSSDKIAVCREKVRRKTCIFHRNFESKILARRKDTTFAVARIRQWPNRILSSYQRWTSKISSKREFRGSKTTNSFFLIDRRRIDLHI